MSSAEYDNMTWSERRNAWRSMLTRAQKQPVKQMTNKQILSKYFTKKGHIIGGRKGRVMVIIPDAMRRPAEVERDELKKELAEARVVVSKLETISGEQHKAYFEQSHITQAQADKLIARDELIGQMSGILHDVLRQHEPNTHDARGCLFRNCLWCKIHAALDNPK